MKHVQHLLALIAVLFGIVTLLAGGRVLLGSNTGYSVYLPLLVFNTAMGVAYVAAGIVAWFDVRRGKHAAAAIFVLNSLALASVGYLYAQHGGVAIESVQAMTLRAGVWLLLLLGFAWMNYRKSDTRQRM